MKKSFISVIAMVMIFCLVLSGCGNGFAKSEYNSLKKITENEDRYAKQNSVFNPIDGGYSLTVSKFDGRQTLWTDTLEENQDVEINFSFTLQAGQAKIVHIDADGNVTTLIECTPESATNEYVTKSASMSGGQNRLKIVGYDCEDVNLEMLFTISD